jgi:hypothetical protein
MASCPSFALLSNELFVICHQSKTPGVNTETPTYNLGFLDVYRFSSQVDMPKEPVCVASFALPSGSEDSERMIAMHCMATPNVPDLPSRRKVYSLAPSNRFMCLRIEAVDRPPLMDDPPKVVCFPISALLEELPDSQLLESNPPDRLVIPWTCWAYRTFELDYPIRQSHGVDDMSGQRIAYTQVTGSQEFELVVLDFDQRRLRARNIHDANAPGEVCFLNDCTPSREEGESDCSEDAPSGKGWHVKTRSTMHLSGHLGGILVDDEHGELYLHTLCWPMPDSGCRVQWQSRW